MRGKRRKNKNKWKNTYFKTGQKLKVGLALWETSKEDFLWLIKSDYNYFLTFLIRLWNTLGILKKVSLF